MNDQQERILGSVLAFFGAIGTGIQLLAMKTPSERYGAFGVSAVFWVYAMLYLYRGNAHHLAVTGFRTRVFGLPKTFVARPAAKEGELREVWSIDKKTFGSHTIKIDLGISWWRKYPKGLITVWRDHQLLGYISFWPLTRTVRCNRFLDHLLFN